MEDDKIRIKLILLGDSRVGKSSIIQRYYENKFDKESKITLDAIYFEKEVTIRGQQIILELWDTAGQEEFRSLTQVFVKNSKIIILVYNVTSLKSFESLNFWYDFLIKEIGPTNILGLAGNKTDLIFEDNYSEEVSPEKAKEFAEKIGASFALVSAKESEKEIVALINELISKYLEIKKFDLKSNNTIRLYSESELGIQNQCCIGKNKKSYLFKTIFLGCKGVGKTSIIKALKGNININNLPPTKESYIEKIYYKKHGKKITVELKDLNWETFNKENFEQEINQYKLFFLVFNIYKKETLYALEDLIKKLSSKKDKVYLLGYNNDSAENNSNEEFDFDYGKEVERLSNKYECQYEYITIDDIYKIKAIILENL